MPSMIQQQEHMPPSSPALDQQTYPSQNRHHRRHLSNTTTNTTHYLENLPLEPVGSSIPFESPAYAAMSPRRRRRYGWLIIFTTFLVQLLVIGTINTFGIYLTYYRNVKYIHSSSEALGWIGTLTVATLNFMGAFTGSLADYIGYRITSLVGVVMMTLALLSTSYVTSVWELFLTQGLMYGLGASLAFFPATALPGQWYRTKRGLAMGISIGGGGIGGLMMAPIVRSLLDNVGYQRTLQIMAGIHLVVLFPACCAFKSTIPSGREIKQLSVVTEMQQVSTFPSPVMDREGRSHLNSTSLGVGFGENNNASTATMLRYADPMIQVQDVDYIKDDNDSVHSPKSEVNINSNRNNSHSATHLHPEGAATSRRSASVRPIESIKIQPRQKVVDFGVLKEPRFLLACFMSMAFAAGFFCPMYYLPSYAFAHSLSKAQSTALLSVMNGLSALGRISIGALSDRLGAFNCAVAATALSALSVLCIWMPSGSSFGVMMLFAILYGLGTGAFTVLKSVVAIQLCGPDKAASVIGMVYLFFGMGNIIGLPVAAAILDKQHETFMGLMLWTGLTLVLAVVFAVALRVNMSKKVFVKV